MPEISDFRLGADVVDKDGGKAGSLASVLLHELGHALVASRFGVRTTEIVMFPIGGLSRMERPLPPTAEICVSWMASRSLTLGPCCAKLTA